MTTTREQTPAVGPTPRQRLRPRALWLRLRGRAPWGRLSRYAAGSVICFLVSEAAFFALFGPGLLGARGASIAASLIGVIPGYYLNRTWTWGRRGRSHLRREVLPYWATVVVSTALAAVVTGAVNHAVLSEPRAERTVINAAAYMLTYGVIFVVKFLLFQQLFAARGSVNDGPGAATRDGWSPR